LEGTNCIGFNCGEVSELQIKGMYWNILVFQPPLIFNVVEV
jgi:hypothetical protein